ncbi:MAG: hypothetical protein J0I20_31090 [Chloroflexi bacterium]|nr:hypothetical protein [Chloroflexota bacterium]OJV94148.1 MAG: hypothetical protein BGO39_11825 [Chloroflexi bacterium 54-19]
MLGILRVRWLITLLPRTIKYFISEKVPFYYKLILLIPIFWALTPVARITNIWPILGLLDEFTIILLTMALFTWLVGRHQLSKAPPVTAKVEIIEGEYYIKDKTSR